ncbi:hypothetical protein PRZ48_006717 [Zasmidium cellare]|uniref:2EXR domain-containing protein n=1 Tax=Zasmidium cellare TaxID=395010 RepID=A0ABR0ENW1_ZASCE|nr:hypothetical protein PRZ48_006717 [Zasmidium cellare]
MDNNMPSVGRDNERDAPQPLEVTVDDTITESRFMNLPPELRNRIYEFAVIDSKPIDLVEPDPTRKSRCRRSNKTVQPPLTLVCRQLRHEVLPIFYALNTFKVTVCANTAYFDDWAGPAEYVAMRWVDRLSDLNKKHLGSIRICAFMSASDATEDFHCNKLYNCAEERVWKDASYRPTKAGCMRDKRLLRGWKWVGDVDVEEGCDHTLEGARDDVGKEVHHHALVWLG